MTPDWAAAPTAVPYATFGDPQTLNLYAYVNNNPNTGIDMDGHVDPCKDVQVTVEKIIQPGFMRNVNNPILGSGLKSGEVGAIIFKITKGGQPMKNVAVSETNQGTKTVNGKTVPLDPVTGSSKSDKNGEFPDFVGSTQKTDGTDKTNNSIQTAYDSSTFISTDTQALTFSANGTVCYATNTRTLTNITPGGDASSDYTESVTPPVVTSTSPPPAPGPSVSAPTPTN